MQFVRQNLQSLNVHFTHIKLGGDCSLTLATGKMHAFILQRTCIVRHINIESVYTNFARFCIRRKETDKC